MNKELSGDHIQKKMESWKIPTLNLKDITLTVFVQLLKMTKYLLLQVYFLSFLYSSQTLSNFAELLI